MAYTLAQPGNGGLTRPQVSALSSTGFTNYLGSLDQFKGKDGLVDFNSLSPTKLEGAMADWQKYGNDFKIDSVNTDKGFLEGLSGSDFGMKGLGGTAVGLGNLALGYMSYQDQKKTAEAQRDLMSQQLAQNKYVMDKSKADSASLAKAFGTA